MELILQIDIDIFAMLICLIMLLNIKRRKEISFFGEKLFLSMLIFNSAILFLDILGWYLDGRTGVAMRELLRVTDTIYYILNPVPCLLWLVYTDYQVFFKPDRLKRHLFYMGIPYILFTCVVGMNWFNEILFTIDSSNQYHRGPLFLLLPGIFVFYMIYTTIFLIMNRRRMEERKFWTLLSFVIPPVLGGILQTLFYGLSFTWPGLTLSLFIIFIHFQNVRADTDFLTGAFNRRRFDLFLQERIDSGKEKPFGLILIDLNSFKQINDQYGHIVGDRVLEQTVIILKKACGKNDLIARYGGDEFAVIVELETKHTLFGKPGNGKADSTEKRLEDRVSRIWEFIRQYNLNTAKPFQVNLSMGWERYNPDLRMTVTQFLQKVDNSMYRDKREKKDPYMQECETSGKL